MQRERCRVDVHSVEPVTDSITSVTGVRDYSENETRSCRVNCGAIWLELDDGKIVHLKRGDVVVQNGTRHAWRNKERNL